MENKTATFEIITTARNIEIGFQIVNQPKKVIAAHWHESIEIVYVLTGSMNLYMMNQNFTYSSKEGFLVNPRVIHSTESSTDNSFILFELPMELLNKYIPDIQRFLFDLNWHDTSPIHQTKLLQFETIILDMQILSEISPDGANLRFTSLLFELIYQLYHNFKYEIPASKVHQMTKNFQQLWPVINYVNDHFREPLSIHQISGIAHLQPQYFCRFFKKHMGKTFLEYLNEYRLNKIYEDLVNTSYPIGVIIEHNGFTNYSLFRKMFYEKYRCTPSELRKTVTIP